MEPTPHPPCPCLDTLPDTIDQCACFTADDLNDGANQMLASIKSEFIKVTTAVKNKYLPARGWPDELTADLPPTE